METSLPSNPLTQETVRDWLIAHIAKVLVLPPADIDPAAPFERFGIDSVAAVDIALALEKEVGRTLDPTLLYHYPTIDKLAEHVASLKA